MTRAILIRSDSTDQGTFGKLFFDGVTLNTLELPWRDNRRQISCIPPGEYGCEIVRSPRFGTVYRVKNVQARDHVLIHPANLAGDAALGWTTELQGCIALGEKTGAMLNNAGKMQRAIFVSRPAVNKLMTWAKGQAFTLEIK